MIKWIYMIGPSGSWQRRLVVRVARIWSVWGTALFVTLNAGSGRSIEDRCRRVTELKPHITTENARAAVGEIDRVIEASKGYAWKSS